MEEILFSPPGASTPKAKTKECHFFSNSGGCNKGADCTFLHVSRSADSPKIAKAISSPKPVASLKPKPVSSSSPKPKPVSSGSPKSVVASPKSSSKPKPSAQVCQWFSAGGCKYGAQCRFVHQQQRAASPAKSVEKRREKKQDVAAALKDALFGWRSFVCDSISKALQDKAVERLVFSNLTDVRVNMLIREGEKRNLYVYVTAPNELSLQRSAFVVPSLAKDESANPLIAYLRSVGSCVAHVGLYNVQFAPEDLKSPVITLVTIGKCKFVQLADFQRDSGKMVHFDCETAISAVQMETLMLKHLAGNMRVNIRNALAAFASSDKHSIVVDPNLDNLERKLVHETVRKLGLKSKSDGPDKARVLTVWKPPNYKFDNISGSNLRSSRGSSSPPPKPAFATRTPKMPLEAVIASAAVAVAVAPLVRDNSNVAPVFVAAVISASVVDALKSSNWICMVCEAENVGADTACTVCFVDREDSEEGNDDELNNSGF